MISRRILSASRVLALVLMLLLATASWVVRTSAKEEENQHHNNGNGNGNDGSSLRILRDKGEDNDKERNGTNFVSAIDERQALQTTSLRRKNRRLEDPVDGGGDTGDADGGGGGGGDEEVTKQGGGDDGGDVSDTGDGGGDGEDGGDAPDGADAGDQGDVGDNGDTRDDDGDGGDGADGNDGGGDVPGDGEGDEGGDGDGDGDGVEAGKNGGDGADDGPKPADPEPVVPSTPNDENEDPCKAASTCEQCQTKAMEVFDASSEDTCAWVMGTDELIACQTVKKSTIADREGDQCSKTASSGTGDGSEGDAAKSTTPPAPSGGSDSLVFPDEDESHTGAIFGLLFLLACGGAAFKYKDKIMSQISAPGGMGGMGGGSVTKTAKYQEVAVNEVDDEEWGWGEDDDDHSGDVELAGSIRDDNSVHKRRSTSHESLPSSGPTQPAASKASPMSSYKKASPRVAMSQVKSHIPTDHQHHIPKLPKAMPTHSTPSISGGSTGMSLKPNFKPVGMPLSSAPTPAAAAATVAQSPATAPAANMPGFSQMQGLKITSLGPKRTAPPPKKAPAPGPRPEDDIFASMGLMAQPKFTHAPAPKSAATTTSSRWTAPLAPAPVAAASHLVSSGNSFDAGDGDDDNWDDDGDLDDLLDD